MPRFDDKSFAVGVVLFVFLRMIMRGFTRLNQDVSFTCQVKNEISVNNRPRSKYQYSNRAPRGQIC